MSDRGRFEHASRVMHRGKHCATCTQFYEAGGVVHPIRNSPGYDPEVEKVQREEKARHAQRERYRGVHEEAHHQTVQRPSWANGLSDRHLIAIAKSHGQSAGSNLWWEKAGLYEGMAERDYALREFTAPDRRKSGERQVARVAPARRERYKPPEDLPF